MNDMNQHSNSPLSVVLATSTGVILATAILYSIQAFSSLSWFIAALAFVAVTMVAGWTCLAILRRCRRPLASLGIRRVLGWVALATTLGWLLTWMVPIPPMPGTPLTITVDALGTHSPQSQGREVWARLVVDGRIVPLDEVARTPAWDSANDFIVSPMKAPPGQFTWTGYYRHGASLMLMTHAWSGNARVSWNGNSRDYDLYSPEGNDFTLRLGGISESPQRLLLPTRTPLQYWVQFCQSVALGLMLLGVLAVARRWPPVHAHPAARESRSVLAESLVAAVPLLVIGTALLAIFFPAIMTVDSLDQWRQAETARYSDAHPVLYAFYLWAIQQIRPSPTLAAWVQMAAMAMASGWLATVVRRACRAPRWTSLAGGALLAIYPLTAVTSITLWKDVPYATSVIALTALVVGAVFFQRPDLRRWYTCMALVLLATACMALRHNGPPVAAAAFVILLVLPGNRLRVLTCVLLAVGLTWAIKGPITDKLDTHRTSAAYMAYSHHLAAHLAAGQVPDSPADAALLRSVDRGASDWRYRCAMVNSTIFDDAFSIPTAVAHSPDLFRIWLEMALKRPDIEAGHILCASGMVWRYRVTNNGPLYLYAMGIEMDGEKSVRWVQPNVDGPQAASMLPGTAQRVGRALMKPWLQRFWRPAPFLIGLVLLTLVAWQRSGDRRVLLIPVLVLVHSAVLMVAIIAQDARYQLPLYAMLLCMAPSLLLARRDNGR